jgi:N-acetylglucosaminyl-diphospho-decaprenol L-rhamnosyltransferase
VSVATVIIVTYNSAHCIGDCLESLRLHEPSTDVVLVDNDSRDGTSHVVRKRFPGVSLVQQGNNKGFAAGVNAGVAASEGDFVFLLNPDSLVSEPLLEKLVTFARTDDSIGAVGPKILNADGSLQHSCRRFPTIWNAVFNRTSLLTRVVPGNRVSRDYLMTDFDHASVRDVDWLSGSALLLRRSALEKVDGMDEGYFLYFEDVDVCHRMHDAGYRVVYNPEVRLTHHISKSSGRLSNKTIIERHRAMWRYWDKYQKGNVVVDTTARVTIWGRCGLQLAGNIIRRP